MKYVDASIQTIDGAHTVDDTTVDVSDAGEFVAPGVVKVWDAADATVLKAVISFTGITTNQLTGCVWDYGGHTDVNLADGDFVAQELSAADVPQATVDVALHRGYTLSHTPHASYAGNKFASNGASPTNGALTAGDSGLFSTTLAYSFDRSVGFDATSRGASPTVSITFDFDPDEAVVSRGAVYGGWDTAQGVYHPAAVDVDYSANGSSWTTFNSISSMGSDPGSRTSARWGVSLDAAPVTRRYWRFVITEANAGGDDWLMLEAVRLYGWIK